MSQLCIKWFKKITGNKNISTTKPNLTKSNKKLKICMYVSMYFAVLFSLILWTRGSRK